MDIPCLNRQIEAACSIADAFRKLTSIADVPTIRTSSIIVLPTHLPPHLFPSRLSNNSAATLRSSMPSDLLLIVSRRKNPVCIKIRAVGECEPSADRRSVAQNDVIQRLLLGCCCYSSTCSCPGEGVDGAYIEAGSMHVRLTMPTVEGSIEKGNGS